jgi:(p)ppGpp synthase/HD superfamily hydrolase
MNLIQEHGIQSVKNQAAIDYAYSFAKEAHHGQVRKYTGEPYITHPVAVAQKVATVTTDVTMLCAALLHDVIEDTSVTFRDLLDQVHGFGPQIALMVSGLTDVSWPEYGNRAERKALDREHTAIQTANCKTVKVCDLLHNTQTIVKENPEFAKIYILEMELLLTHALREAEESLLLEAWQIIHLWKWRYNV